MNETSGDSPKELILKAREKALNLLSYSDKTEYLLREKLKEGDFPPSVIDDAIEYVKSFHYLDDLRYAENFIRSHRGTKSIREMKEKLREKGVSKENLEAAFSAEETDEEETVKQLFLKKYRTKVLSDPKVYEKAVRYLSAKGFSYEVIRRGVRSSIEELKNAAEFS